MQVLQERPHRPLEGPGLLAGEVEIVNAFREERKSLVVLRAGWMFSRVIYINCSYRVDSSFVTEWNMPLINANWTIR